MCAEVQPDPLTTMAIGAQIDCNKPSDRIESTMNMKQLRSRNRRSLLALAALATDQFHSAVTSGVDMVMFDLEDSTVASRKDEARQTLMEYLQTSAPAAGGALRVVRINTPRCLDGLRDLDALASCRIPPDGVVIPKVAHPEEVRWVDDLLCGNHPQLELIPLLETPAGIASATCVARASERVSALFLGSVDLSGELGSDMSWDALCSARGVLVRAAAEAGVDSIDGPFLDVDDTAGLDAEVARVAALGFTGKALYDLGQRDAIHKAFTPSDAAIAAAERVIQAVQSSPVGAARVDGKPVNKANLKAAERLLTLAARRGVLRGRDV
ncbi:MAG: CoA ester lyase [Pseudomonadota bacterium]